MLENNLNINMLQARCELTFCRVAQVLSLEKNLAPSYTQRADKPEERSSLMQSHSDGDPNGISGKQASECLWHLAHPDICSVSHEDCVHWGITGMETMQESSPSLLWHVWWSAPLKSPPSILPASQDICRLFPGNFSRVHQPKERWEKIYMYWKAHKYTWSAPR